MHNVQRIVVTERGIIMWLYSRESVAGSQIVIADEQASNNEKWELGRVKVALHSISARKLSASGLSKALRLWWYGRKRKRGQGVGEQHQPVVGMRPNHALITN